MANTFTWKVKNLERYLSDNRVHTVHYTVSAVSDVVNETGDLYTSGAYGSVGLDGELTVDFANLTEEVVIGWVKEALGGDEKVAEIETALANQIEQKITPSTAVGVPW